MFIFVAAIILSVLLFKIYYKLTIGRCRSPVCLIGKTVLITGGNSGMGFQTALALAGRGCRLIIADKDDCEKSREKIIHETGNTNIVKRTLIKQFDLASLSSVRKLAKDITETEERLDILINNAGTIGYGNVYTEDGLNKEMQVNHFGPFLLTHLLVGLLKKSAPSRIIFVSSVAAFFADLTIKTLNFPKSHSLVTYSEVMAYANSKLCAVLTAQEFANKLKRNGVTANSLHPGIVDTPILKKVSSFVENGKEMGVTYFLLHWLIRFIFKDAEEGAQTTIHMALAKELEEVTGKYFQDCKPYRTPNAAKDQNFSLGIWKGSEDYVKLLPEEKL